MTSGRIVAGRPEFPLVAVILLLGLLLASCYAPVGRRAATGLGTARVSELEGRMDKRLAERHFVDGSLFEMRDRYRDAITEYRRALYYDSTQSAIYYAIGKSFKALHESDSAIAYTSRAVSLAPREVDAHRQLAELLMTAGSYDSAVAEYRAILDLLPDDLQARYMVARMLQRSDVDSAIVHYEYLLRNLTDDFDVMVRLADLYLQRGNADGAVRVMRQMLRTEPDDPDLHQSLMSALLDTRHFDAALEILTRAETTLPPGAGLRSFHLAALKDLDDRVKDETGDDSLVQFTRTFILRAAARANDWTVRMPAGLLALRIGDTTQAEALLSRALQDSALDVESWTQAAAAFLRPASAGLGARLLLPSARRFAEEPRAALMEGLLLDLAGQSDSAVAWLRHAVEVNTDNADAWGALARIYTRRDQPGLAEAAYDKAIAADPDDANVLNNYAFDLARRGTQLEKALQLSVRALEIDPENPSYLDTHGWVLFRLGRTDQAVEFLRRAAEHSDNAEVFDHLGDVEAILGNGTAARAAYKRASQLNPYDETLQRKLEDEP